MKPIGKKNSQRSSHEDILKIEKNKTGKKPFYCNSGLHRIVLFFLVFLFYANSIPNQYALDDSAVVEQNKFVKKGIAGIPDILKHDIFYGASGKNSTTSGGRYRPLSLISFAVEHAIFGEKPNVFHFFNVLFYALLCLLIYQWLLRFVFEGNSIYAFVTTLLFAAHPIHTEVVANIKSRDEIFSLLFLAASTYALLKYLRSERNGFLVISCLCYFLALLSKENGIVFLVMAPLTVYVFSDKKIGSIVKLAIPFVLVFILYLVMRITYGGLATDPVTDVMFKPYLYASLSQKFATIIWVFAEYLKLIFYPTPLSYDYSYNQVPYVNFSNIQVIISIAVNGLLLSYGIYATVKRRIAGYCIIFYFISLFIISNILVNIGTPLAERFLFAPILFFLTAIILELKPLINKISWNISPFITLFLFSWMLFSFTLVYSRNQDWKDNHTLYYKDLKTCPNSARTLAFCAMTLVPETDQIPDSLTRVQTLKEAVGYFEKSYAIDSSFYSIYQNWGGAYFRLHNLDSAEWAWNRMKKLRPESKFIRENDELIRKSRYNQYLIAYQEALKQHNSVEMLEKFRLAIRYNDKLPEGWYLMGQLYQMNHKTDSAVIALKKCLELQPSNEQAALLLKNLSN